MSLLNSTILNTVAGENDRLIAGAVGMAIIFATTAACYVLSPKEKAHEFPKLRGIQLYHAWNFYRARYDFLQSNFKRNLGKSFSFNILHHSFLALSGEDARRIIYSKNFHVSEGVMILLGGVCVPPAQQQAVPLILIVTGTPGRGRGCSRRRERRRDHLPLPQKVV